MTEEKKTIRRNLVLSQTNIKILPDGRRHIFSIKFVDAKGKLRYFPQAYSCGLPYDMKSHRLIAIQPCDCKGNAEGHVYPVNIDMIVLFKNMEVIL
jgi:hypothetical protein